MNLIQKIFYFLCPAAFPLYNTGGGGGSSEETSKTTKSTPWDPVIPYMKDYMAEAQRTYEVNGQPQYTPFSQVAQLTPEQLQYVGGVRDYVNSQGTQDFMNRASGTVNNLMKGGNNPYASSMPGASSRLSGYLGNNTMYDPSSGINRFMYQNTTDPSLQGNVENAISSVSPVLSDNLANMIQAGPGREHFKTQGDTQRNNMITGMMTRAYDTQDKNRLDAMRLGYGNMAHAAGTAADVMNAGKQYGQNAQRLGLANYSNVLNSPIGLLGAYGDAGRMLQEQNQSQINDAVNRWQFGQNAAFDNLARYRNMIMPDNTYGTTTTTATGGVTNSAPQQSAAGGIAGGALSGAATGATFGPWGALAGGLIGAGLGYAGSR